jgi:hypothetical protein
VLFQDNFQGTISPAFVVAGSSTNPNPDLTATVTVTDQTPRVGEPVRIKFTLKNPTGASAPLVETAGNGITILKGNKVVAQKSLPGLQNRVIKPGKRLQLTAVWNGKPSHGVQKALAPGLYTIEVDEDGYVALETIRIK